MLCNAQDEFTKEATHFQDLCLAPFNLAGQLCVKIVDGGLYFIFLLSF